MRPGHRKSRLGAKRGLPEVLDDHGVVLDRPLRIVHFEEVDLGRAEHGSRLLGRHQRVGSGGRKTVGGRERGCVQCRDESRLIFRKRRVVGRRRVLHDRGQRVIRCSERLDRRGQCVDQPGGQRVIRCGEPLLDRRQRRLELLDIADGIPGVARHLAPRRLVLRLAECLDGLLERPEPVAQNEPDAVACLGRSLRARVRHGNPLVRGDRLIQLVHPLLRAPPEQKHPVEVIALGRAALEIAEDVERFIRPTNVEVDFCQPDARLERELSRPALLAHGGQMVGGVFEPAHRHEILGRQETDLCSEVAIRKTLKH